MLRSNLSICLFLVILLAFAMPALADGSPGATWRTSPKKCSDIKKCAPDLITGSLCIVDYKCKKKPGQKTGLCSYAIRSCSDGAVCDGESGECAMPLEDPSLEVCKLGAITCDLANGSQNCNDFNGCTVDAALPEWNESSQKMVWGCHHYKMYGCDSCTHNRDCPSERVCSFYTNVCVDPPLSDTPGDGNTCDYQPHCLGSPWGLHCVKGFCQECVNSYGGDPFGTDGCVEPELFCNEGVWQKTFFDGQTLERPENRCAE